MSDSTEKQNDLMLAAVDADYTSLITIDNVIDNTGQHQGPVAQYGETDDLLPTLTGFVPYDTSGALILRVYLNSVAVGTAHVQADGSWTYTAETPLEAGTLNYFQVVLLDPAGNTQLRLSDPYYINTTAPDQDIVTPDVPDVPVIDSVADNVQGGITGDLANGSLTNDARPELTGHAMAGATVNIYDNDALIGTAIAAADGSWRFTPETDLSEGAHNLSATAMNAAGESASTDGFALTVDTEVATPVLTAIVDNVGDYQTDVLNGGKTDDRAPLLTGTGEPGSHIVIKMYGPVTHKTYTIGTVEVGEDGTWSYQFKGGQGLQAGDNVFHITATDAAGNTMAGEDFVLELTGSNQDNNDTTPPDAPVITAAQDNAGSITGELVNGDKTDDTTPELRGTAEAGSLVTIYDGSTLLGSINAESDGTWSFTAPENNKGEHVFTVTATDAAGNTSLASNEFVLNIDPVPQSLFFEGVKHGGGESNLENGELTNDNTLLYYGHATAGATVNLYDNGVLFDSRPTYSNGSWNFGTYDRVLKLKDGTHHITVTEVVNGIESAPSDPFIVNIDTKFARPILDSVIVHQGGDEIALLDDGKTYDSRPVLHGHAEANSMVTIRLATMGSNETIYTGSVIAGEDGNWVYQLNTLEAQNSYSITLGGKDAAGNTLGTNSGDEYHFQFLSGEPVINYCIDNDAATIHVDNGGTTDDRTPKLGGGGIPDATVTIYDGNNVIGTTKSGSDGSWSFTPPSRLGLGEHDFTITMTDASGHTSAHSGIYEINVVQGGTPTPEPTPDPTPDPTPNPAPSVPLVITTENGQALSGNIDIYNGAVTLAGTGNPSYPGNSSWQANVYFNINGQEVRYSTPIDANGHWSMSITGLNLPNDAIQSVHLTASTDNAGVDGGFYSLTVHEGGLQTLLAVEDLSSTHHVIDEHSVSLHSDANHDAAPSADTLAQPETGETQMGQSIHDAGQEPVTLTLDQILSEAHDNLFIQDGHKQLAVTGDAGDVVELKVEDLAHNAWQDVGQVTAGGVQYEVYQHTGSHVELLVQHGVELHQVS